MKKKIGIIITKLGGVEEVGYDCNDYWANRLDDDYCEERMATSLLVVTMINWYSITDATPNKKG